jgi:hypothetical protein
MAKRHTGGRSLQLILLWSLVTVATRVMAKATNSSSTEQYSYFQELRGKAWSEGNIVESVTRPNSGVIRVIDAGDGSDGEAYRLCPLTSILPYTSVRKTISTNTSSTTTTRGLLDTLHKQRPGVVSDTVSILVAQHVWNTQMAQAISPSVSDLSTAPCNVRFTNTFFDTQSNPIRTTAYLSSIFRSSQKKPCAVLGPFTSAATVPTAVLSSVYNTPQMGYGLASIVDLSDTEQYPYYHRIMASTDVEARAVLEYIVKNLQATEEGVFHIGLIHSSDSNGHSFSKSVTDLVVSSPDWSSQMVVEKVAISFDAHLDKQQEDNTDISSAIRRLKSTGYKYMLAAVLEEQYSFVMEEAFKQGIAGGDGDYFWMVTGMDLLSLQQIINVASEKSISSRGEGAGEDVSTSALLDASNGMGVFQWKPAGEGANCCVEGESLSSGYEFFRAACRTAIKDPSFQSYAIQNLPPDVKALLLKDTGTDEIMFEHLEAEPTTFGYALYDAVITLGRAACQVTPPGDEATDSYLFDGPELSAAISNVAFDNDTGASGPVSFDAATRTRQHNTYGMYNLLSAPKTATTTTTTSQAPATTLVNQLSSQYSETNGEWTLVTPFVYSSGSTEVPPSLPPVNYNPNYIGQGARVTGWILCGCIIFLGLLCSAWTVYQQARVPVIDASGQMFLHSTVVGCIVVACSIIPLSLEEPVVDSISGLNTACQATPWLYHTGFALIISGMLAKTYMLYTIGRTKHDSTTLRLSSTQDVMNAESTKFLLAFCICFSVTFLMLLTQQLVAPLEWDRVPLLIVDEYNRNLQTYGTCTSQNFALEEATKAFIFVWNTLLLLVGNIVAYRSRNFRTEYKESHYITLILASILQSHLISFPIMIVVSRSPSARFWVNTCIVVVITCSTLGLLFVPKVLAVRNIWKDDEKVRIFLQARAQATVEGRAQGQEQFTAQMDTDEFYNDGTRGRGVQRRSSVFGRLRTTLRSSLAFGDGGGSGVGGRNVSFNDNFSGTDPVRRRSSVRPPPSILRQSPATTAAGGRQGSSVDPPTVQELQSQLETIRKSNMELEERNEQLRERLNNKAAETGSIAATEPSTSNPIPNPTTTNITDEQNNDTTPHPPQSQAS